MTSLNYDKLQQIIEASGVTMTALADKMGVSRTTIYNKVNGASEFSISEIAKFCSVLRLSDAERDAIFFME